MSLDMLSGEVRVLGDHTNEPLDLSELICCPDLAVHLSLEDRDAVRAAASGRC